MNCAQGLLAMPGVAVPFPVCCPADDPEYTEPCGVLGGYSISADMEARLPPRWADV